MIAKNNRSVIEMLMREGEAFLEGCFARCAATGLKKLIYVELNDLRGFNIKQDMGEVFTKTRTLHS